MKASNNLIARNSLIGVILIVASISLCLWSWKEPAWYTLERNYYEYSTAKWHRDNVKNLSYLQVQYNKSHDVMSIAAEEIVANCDRCHVDTKLCAVTFVEEVHSYVESYMNRTGALCTALPRTKVVEGAAVVETLSNQSKARKLDLQIDVEKRIFVSACTANTWLVQRISIKKQERRNAKALFAIKKQQLKRTCSQFPDSAFCTMFSSVPVVPSPLSFSISPVSPPTTYESANNHHEGIIPQQQKLEEAKEKKQQAPKDAETSTLRVNQRLKTECAHKWNSWQQIHCLVQKTHCICTSK